MNSQYEILLKQLQTACQSYYADRLVSLLVFGSVGRGTPHPNSDIDFLIVADPLPNGRIARVNEFLAVEKMLEPTLAQARQAGLFIELSPIFKTPAQAQQGSPLFLDMIDDSILLYDRDNWMRRALEQFKQRLDKLGARRIWRGDAWFWDLKPNYQSGEVFEL